MQRSIPIIEPTAVTVAIGGHSLGAVYPSLGIGATRGTRYARAWRIPTPRIGPVTPSTPCSTPRQCALEEIALAEERQLLRGERVGSIGNFRHPPGAGAPSVGPVTVT